MQFKPYKVLFLCTGNSARSVFGEYLLRRIGGSRFVVYSAGSFPTGTVNPFAVRVLRDVYHIDAGDARSKSWEEFQGTEFDFVITVCDNARESCPVWPGQPIVAHWGVNDPAAFTGPGDAKEQFFYEIALQLHRRVQLLVSLPIEKLSRLKVEKLTRDIGKGETGDTEKGRSGG